MKMRAAIAMLLALGFTAGANAASSRLEQLAADSGLTTRQVKMVLGAPVAYAEYRSSYQHLRQVFIRAVGEKQYQELVLAYQKGQLPKRTAANAG